MLPPHVVRSVRDAKSIVDAPENPIQPWDVGVGPRGTSIVLLSDTLTGKGCGVGPAFPDAQHAGRPGATVLFPVNRLIEDFKFFDSIAQSTWGPAPKPPRFFEALRRCSMILQNDRAAVT